MKIISFFVQSIFLALMIGVAGLFLLPYVPFDHGIELRIVESGSMEPSIMTGALVVVRDEPSYAAGDVITFTSRFSEVPTTHRITDSYQQAGQTWFVTKGDANEERDTTAVMAGNVLGKVLVDVPRVGFILDFARQPMGFMFLIVLPACLIILSEIEKIWREIRRNRNLGNYPDDSDSPQTSSKDTKPDFAPARTAMMDIATPVRRLELPTLDLRTMSPYRPARRRAWHWDSRTTAGFGVLLFSVLVASSGFIGSTVSYFNDFEQSVDNIFSAITLDVLAAPDGEVYNFVGSDIDDDDGAVVIFLSPEADSVAVHYSVSTDLTSSSTVLCDALELDAASPLVYSGPLAGLGGAEVLFDAPWEIAFSLPDTGGLSGGETCHAEIVLTAWHDDAATDRGYFDEERIPLSFSYTAPAPAFAPVLLNTQTLSLEQTTLSATPTKPVLPEAAKKGQTIANEAQQKQSDPEPSETESALGENKEEGEEEETEADPSEDTTKAKTEVAEAVNESAAVPAPEPVFEQAE